MWRIADDGNDKNNVVGERMSFLDRLREAQARLAAERYADPFRQKIEAAVRSKDAISTTALLDLLEMPKTTGNARRVSKVMRSMGFVPIKSRRLMPGGFRDTVARGWARPIRETRFSTPTIKQTSTAGANEEGVIT